MKKKIDVYQIESSVPVPSRERSLPPLRQLKVGESIVFPYEKRRNVQSYASQVKRDTGFVFRVQKQDNETARVWRVE